MKKLLTRSLICLFLFGQAWTQCLSVGIDYLYWKFDQEQLFFVGKNSFSSPSNSIEIASQEFEYTSGFRTQIGYFFPCENYLLSLDWTHFWVKQTTDYAAPAGGNLIAIDVIGLTNAGDVPGSQGAQGAWHMNFNILDLALSHRYCIGQCFTLVPMMGLKGGWIYQTQHVSYPETLVATGDLETTFATLKTNFKGIGPTAGCEMRYGSRWGIFTTWNAALLYGHFDVETTLIVPTAGSPTTDLSFDVSRNRILPFGQMMIGVDWEGCWCRRWNLHFGAAYELQYWWNLVRAPNNLVSALYVNYKAGGDLMSQGLTLHGSIAF